MSHDITQRLAKLRQAMHQYSVDACLIPSSDPHLSEYLPRRWQARAYFSGFDGSAGTLLVTRDFAGLWTDSRYFEQAEQQLTGTGIHLMKLGVADQPDIMAWLRQNLQPGQCLAVAGDSIAISQARRLQTITQATGAHLRTDLDIPDQAWPQRPGLPGQPIQAHELTYAGTARADKLAAVRATMADWGATHHLISSLDDIAWLTNLRGSDVAFNPVFLAHLLLEKDSCHLFLDSSQCSAELAQTLATAGIQLWPYEAITQHLAQLPDDAYLLYDPERVVSAVIDAVPSSLHVIEQPNPSTDLKAVKTDTELAHIRQTMREDGAALVKAFYQIESRLQAGDTITELDVAAILHEQRALRPGFVTESFPTIAAYGANAALPHYQARPEAHATLETKGLLLVDSGGQYLGGTTDLTRIWAFGPTTAEQRQDSTAVLKGLIHLSRTCFPKGASGQQLDALARAPIWAIAADYGHGTGHGVGYFLNVHDGPQSITPPRNNRPAYALKPGMITSIEPGLYKPGRHGIRHENLTAVYRDSSSEFGQFLAFETLTLCPLDTRAIDPEQLSTTEREWLDAYHARVLAQLSPLLEAEEQAWLEQRCQPLQ